jgi:hypothetical protein
MPPPANVHAEIVGRNAADAGNKVMKHVHWPRDCPIVEELVRWDSVYDGKN